MQSLWTWLNTPPALPDVLDPFALAFAAVFTLGFLASAYLAGPAGHHLARDDRGANAIHHWSTVGLWLFAPGLFFLAIRLLQINPLSFAEPIWLIGSLLAFLIAALRFAAWRRKSRQPLIAARSCPSDEPHDKAPLSHAPWERGIGG